MIKTVNDKMNKASICSIVSLEIVDYSKKTDAEQLEIKNLFNRFIDHAVIDIPQNDRVIVNTGYGAAIACNGPLEDALEDALFISITIRDEILKHNTHDSTPLYVQFGINLGSVRVVNNTKTQPNIVGEGMDEAQRIMSFANPNQILVSHVYFEMASKLTQEISQMFEKYEMHAHEHDVYAVRMLKEGATEESPSIPTDNSDTEPAIASKINWMYVGTSLLVLAAFFVLAKLVLKPTEPTIIFEQPAVVEKQPTVADTTTKPEATLEPVPAQTAEPTKTAEPTETAKPVEAIEPTKTAKPMQDEPIKTKVVQKKPTEEATVEAEPTNASAKPVASKTEKPAASVAENKTHTNVAEKATQSKTEKSATKQKSGWQSFKDSVTRGSESKCTQAEIVLNQCTK